MKLKIGDSKWTLKVLTHKAYTDLWGPNTLAMTNRTDNTIHFIQDYVTIETVRHELFHAYMNQSCIYSADLNMYNTEEVCAEIIAKYLPEYVKNVALVYKKIGTPKDE